MISDLGLIKLFLVSGLICSATAVVCPHLSQWNLRTRARCNSSLPSYNCLYDESTSTYVEFCTRTPDFQRPGYKFIIRGNIDGTECEKNRFQPFKFWTNGSYSCSLQKSGCNEPGQVIQDEGNSTSDRTCRCDYTRGFGFVTRPKRNCFCHPSREDCSCFLNPCSKKQVMTPDYKCIEAIDWTGIFECPVITKTITTSATTKKPTRCPITQQDLNKFSIMTMVSKKQKAIVVTVLTGTVVVIVIVLWKRGKEMKTCCIRLCMPYIEKKMDERMHDYVCFPDIEKQLDERMHDHTVFKRKLKVNFQDIITKINSSEIVGKLTLTDSEKKSVLAIACLGRIKGNKALLEIVWNRGLIIYKEFMKVLRENNPRLAFKIENTKDGDYQEEFEEELEKIYNEKIPDHVRKFHESQIQNWLLDDKTIIRTKASDDISKLLQENNCVFVVGRPGSGKSSILRHIALRHVEEHTTEDFDIIPVVIEPSKVLEFYHERRNQIFLLDDFCGKQKVNNELLELWKYEIEKILNIINQSDCKENGEIKVFNRKNKILISCNTSVYNDKCFEPLKNRLHTFVFELSAVPLTPEERVGILKKYAPTAEVHEYMDNKDHIDFPLLCKLSKGKNMEEIRLLFLDPFKTIKDDLKNVQTNDKDQFCAIALCTLFGNKFKSKWLNLNCEDIRRSSAVKEMCLEFNLDLLRNKDMKQIKDQFEKEMNWLCKSEDTFRHIHDEIFNIASVICGELYKRCFINHAPSFLIAHRFHSEESNDECISLEKKYQKIYFDRLFRDLENGIIYSTFRNTQLKNANYRKDFIAYCEIRQSKLEEILVNMQTSDFKEKRIKPPLSKQATLNFDITSVQCPLIVCAWQGYADIVELLLKAKYNVDEQDMLGRSALFVASQRGQLNIVKILVNNKCNIDILDEMKRTSLYVACKEGHKDIVEFLIEKKADISACDIDGYSPLHMACESGQTDIVKFLLRTYKAHKKEDEIEKPDNIGQTPMIYASSKGNIEVVKLLMQRNVNFRATDRTGFTPLMAAIMNGQTLTAKYLISQDANIFHLDNEGRSVLYIACEKGHTKIVNMLIEKDKKNMEICDWHERSPIYIACAEGRSGVVEKLIQEGANKNKCDEEEKSPIYVACEKGHDKTVEVLIKYKANIEKSDIHQNLPLHVACKGGDLKIVKLLQHYKDCSRHVNKWNETALDVALKQGHDEIIQFFTAHASNINGKEQG